MGNKCVFIYSKCKQEKTHAEKYSIHIKCDLFLEMCDVT